MKEVFNERSWKRNDEIYWKAPKIEEVIEKFPRRIDEFPMNPISLYDTNSELFLIKRNQKIESI